MKRFQFLIPFLFCVTGAFAGTMVIRRAVSSGSDSVLHGGTIGRTTSNNSAARGANEFIYSSFTATAGQINYCQANFNNISIGQGVTIGVYDTSGNILAYANFTSTGTAQANQGASLNTAIQLTGGTSYILGMVTQDTAFNFFRQDSLTGFYRHRISMTYATTLANATFTGATSDSENSAWRINCWDTGP